MSAADWLDERERIAVEALAAVAIAKSTNRPSFDLAGVALDKSRMAGQDARESLPKAVAALRAVLDLHRPMNDLGNPPCEVCLTDDEDGLALLVP